MAERRPLFLLSLIGLVTTTAAAAAPLSQPYNRAALASAVEKAVANVSEAPPAQPPILERVWEGVDLDGDGRGDFVNPTGHETRTHDAYGFGHFGARRDGGSRRHSGVDYVANAGQTVASPISGYVTKIGYAYSGEQSLKFVEVTNPALQVAARVFYIDPKVEVGQAVAMGRPIGRAKSLQRKYPGGMTDHVHLEIIDRRGERLDAQTVITAQYRPIDSHAAD
ncbi:MAG: peptidoglycan DD-metalloendopeptidase family protein [Phenylobacterium sp.]|nr:peptidoglycan DD-metalloendopeptidase family protein [Phenylobacterium sp.]